MASFQQILVWLATSLLATSSAAYKITGATGGTDSTTGLLPLRQEIHDFATTGAAFDLYILSLQQMQQMNHDEAFSYFQIAGIHGFPVQPWDGVIGTAGGSPGFGMHSSVLFPTWHRPYLALFEQLIWAQAQEIARKYPEDQRGEYMAAAIQLRIPYWDWAVNPALPSVATSPDIAINTPDGFGAIRNPLYQYNFPAGPDGSGIPVNHPVGNMTSTVRYWNWQSGRSNQSAATSVMLANAPTVLATTYQLLASVTDYTAFSSVASDHSSFGTNSLEYIHNCIHVYVGGYRGHMHWVDVAAFDPIFWLHHVNVDRLFAMWQVLNPIEYVVPTVNHMGSYFESASTIDNNSTELAPFHSDDGTTLFTSNDVRDTTALGYTYPELSNRSSDTEDMAARIRTAINRLYAPLPSYAYKRINRSAIRRATNLAQAFGHVDINIARKLGLNNLDVQWSIQITADRDSYRSSYSIDFFIGEMPPISKSSLAPNLIGSYSHLIVGNWSCALPGRAASARQHGEVSMTHVLAAGVSRGFLEDLSPDSVLPLLRHDLSWQARSEDDTEVNLSSLSGLCIQVTSRHVRPRQSIDTFPRYGEYEVHQEVTAGKDNGACGASEQGHSQGAKH